METRVVIVVGLVGLGWLTLPAYALKPSTHASVALQSCRTAGLATDLCTRIATEDYNTDQREWDDLRAHAQIDDDQTACTAANQTSDRMWTLGQDLRTTIATFARSRTTTDAGAVASAIGRALHTVQDDCAHHGMPNPQHAWFSLGDFCDGTATSPDVQSDAIACARVESDALFATVASAIRDAGVGSQLGMLSCPPAPDQGSQPQTPVCARRYLPGPFDGCDFLSRAADWDGIDRTWNDAVVAPALRTAFAAGLAGQPAAVGDAICHGDERVLSSATSRPTVDVTQGPPSCIKSHVLCLGKADDGGDVESPFADDPADDLAGEAGTGCAAAGGGGAGSALAIWIAAVSVRRRRRR